jgi:hypothetical protein
MVSKYHCWANGKTKVPFYLGASTGGLEPVPFELGHFALLAFCRVSRYTFSLYMFSGFDDLF